VVSFFAMLVALHSGVVTGIAEHSDCAPVADASGHVSVYGSRFGAVKANCA